ncbi:MAG: hypothetical protein KKB46_04470, partial [Candidatus Omnitrophica bacterium]|nr:hypothetical protein [Candidatus Omnitrophota bacterium]
DSDDWDFGTGDFTIDFWIHPTALDNSVHFINQFVQDGADWDGWGMRFTTSGENPTVRLGLYDNNNPSILQIDASSTIKNNTWHHLAFVRNGNTVYIYQDGNLIGSGAYSGSWTNPTTDLFIGGEDSKFNSYNFTGYIDDLRISKGIARWTANFTPPTAPHSSVNESVDAAYSLNYSCLFNDDDSDYLSKDMSPGSSRSKFIFSTWVKRGNIGGTGTLFGAEYSSSYYTVIRYSSDKIYFRHFYGADSGTYQFLDLQRDPTGWVHIVVQVDSTDATETDRVKVWFNGVRATRDTGTYTALVNNGSLIIGNDDPHYVGWGNTGGGYFDGYMAETIYLDGQTYTYPPSLFGQNDTTTGHWIPKEISGLTYGNNGFYLNYANSTNLGFDISGNNNLTASGSPAQVTDTPTNNYCTLNPINTDFGSVGAEPTYSMGNTKQVNGNPDVRGTKGTLVIPTTGKWYWEVLNDGIATAAANQLSFGVVELSKKTLSTYGSGAITFLGSNNRYVYNNSGVVWSDGANWASGTVLRIAYDADNDKLWFGQGANWLKADGSTGADPGAGTDPTIASVGLVKPLTPFLVTYQLYAKINFGPIPLVTGGHADNNCYGNFEYAPPAGFLALNTNNLPTPSVKKPSTGIYVSNRTGTGAAVNITNVDFNVSAGALVIIKNRNQADEWKVVDTVRGVTKEINFDPDSNPAESTDANGLTAFSSSGFTLGTGANGYNDNAENFLDWALREGTSFGLDIIAYTGTGVARTISHNLGRVPTLIIVKRLDQAENGFFVYHALCASDPETDYGYINLTQAFADDNIIWNDTAPTSSVFTVGTGSGLNASGGSYIAYVFADIPGYCKAFAYTGNGNPNGPYMPLGFRPAAFFMKRTSVAENWIFYHVGESTYNPCEDFFFFDDTLQEGCGLTVTNYSVDICSKGLKIRGQGMNENNGGNDPYIGFAWAAQPGKYSNAR